MKALIIEDELLIAEEMRENIKAVSDDVEVLDVLPSLKAARKWFTNNAEPDLLFMDIKLSDGVSFELFDQFTLKCPVIFCTAYEDYAIRAFKVNGVDYLLKPVQEDDLKKAIDKCRTILQSNTPNTADLKALILSLANPSSGSLYKQKFIVNVRNQWIPINTADIACFSREILNCMYLFGGERYQVDYTTLDEIEELLDPKIFYRANRQFIINIEAVKTVKPIENSKLLIKLKEPNQSLEIDLSRLKTAEFKKWLDR